MEVSIECRCPGEHGQDVITFYDRLDFDRANNVGNALAFIDNNDPETRPAEVLTVLSKNYLYYGIEHWTLVGPDRKPLEINPASVRSELLEHPDVSLLVEAANEQYGAQVLLPLVKRAARSSQDGQTDGSTSPTPSSRQPTRKQSSRSSISTIQTVATEATSSSLDGVSNSSQRSESAA